MNRDIYHDQNNDFRPRQDGSRKKPRNMSTEHREKRKAVKPDWMDEIDSMSLNDIFTKTLKKGIMILIAPGLPGSYEVKVQFSKFHVITEVHDLVFPPVDAVRIALKRNFGMR